MIQIAFGALYNGLYGWGLDKYTVNCLLVVHLKLKTQSYREAFTNFEFPDNFTVQNMSFSASRCLSASFKNHPLKFHLNYT